VFRTGWRRWAGCGRDLAIVAASPMRSERLPALAAELVRERVDVIVPLAPLRRHWLRRTPPPAAASRRLRALG
jgi:hypothetical protein